MATFVFFDAYRSESVNDKAAYTIGDAISRESTITPTYLASMLNVHRMMTFAKDPTHIRVSVLRWDETDNRHYVVWSERQGIEGEPALSDADVAPGSTAADRMPAMSDDERLIVVETWLPYQPLFNIGLGAFDFTGLTVISPRYAPQLCYDRNATGDRNEMAC